MRTTKQVAGRRSRLRLTSGAAILAVIVMALLFASVVPVRTYLEQRSRLSSLEGRIETLRDENANLGRRVAQLHDPEHLERIARRCFGMVRPGEIAFILIPEGGAAKPPVC